MLMVHGVAAMIELAVVEMAFARSKVALSGTAPATNVAAHMATTPAAAHMTAASAAFMTSATSCSATTASAHDLPDVHRSAM
jgi:hypothetical protein